MPFRSPHRNGDRELPDEVYISLVKSLFSDPRNLINGAAGTIAAGLITAVKAWDPVLLLCTVALAAVTLARAQEMRAFRVTSDAILDVAAARRWEHRYVAGSCIYMILMGTWCFACFSRSADAFVQLISFAMVIVNVIGIVGRNFGSKLLVSVQLICAGVPLCLSLLWTGNLYYFLTILVLAPFFRSFSTIGDRLRQTLTGAIVAAHDVRLLADRLDAALNNMSHGLCMVDRDGKIAISNHRLPQLLNVSPAYFEQGRSALEAFLACARTGTDGSDAIGIALSGLGERIAQRRPASMLLPISGDRILSVTSRGMPNGSSVMLVEEVTEQKKAEARISRLAHYDSLTGLANRVSFRDSVTRLLDDPGAAKGCALLFIDLDEFKQVNDVLGHPSGDALLKLVAARLRAVAGDQHMIARLGGDEFVVLQAPLSNAGRAESLARAIVAKLSAPYNVNGHVVVIGASVGIATSPAHGTDADTLLKNADLAVYRAKAEGRNTYRFFEIEMEVRMKERRALELDLHDAVTRRAFELHYQPIVNLTTGRISSCEALLRWRHPERGFISPAEAIPLAEEMGLIVEIGRWALIEACTEAARWPAGSRVSVNLSPVQFRHGGLVAAIEEALAVSGLPAGQLDLEITESTLLRDTSAVLEVLHEIRRMGASISLDDFGTGYSSLSYILRFPLQTVKIDRSFLAGIESNEKQRIVLRGISRLCGELGVGVVVEGVETYEQLDVISTMRDIGQAQGFLFAKPAAAAHVRDLLAAGFIRSGRPGPGQDEHAAVSAQPKRIRAS